MNKRQKSLFFSRIILVLSALFFLGVFVYCGINYIRNRRQWNREADRYAQIASEEKEWILSCQSEDGMILPHRWEEDHDGCEQTVIPYFSNIAAVSLLAGTPDDRHIQSAKAYILWYFSHLNTDQSDPVNGSGTIYDYQIIRTSDGSYTEKSTGDYDSVDSYAATFLILARQYMEKGEIHLLETHADELMQIIRALLRTLGPNGLSVVKKQFPVQYLMDNSEVYQGLLAAEALSEQVSALSGLRPQLQQSRENLQTAVNDLLWNGRYYEVGLTDHENPFDAKPGKNFYPDSTAQLFPIIFQLIDRKDTRSKALYEEFSDTWDLAHLGFRKGKETYWCAAAYAAARMRDQKTVDEFMHNYRASISEFGRKYPLNTSDAGWAAMACSEMEHYYRCRIW